jgi:hypothetical protein
MAWAFVGLLAVIGFGVYKFLAWLDAPDAVENDVLTHEQWMEIKEWEYHEHI